MTHQKLFLKEFIGSFEGFQSGKGISLPNYEPGVVSMEILDKFILFIWD